MELKERFAYGVEKFDGAGMQGDARSWPSRPAVFDVSQDGEAPLTELDANLVLSPGLKIDFQQCASTQALQNAVRELRPTSVGGLRTTGDDSAQSIVLSEPVLQNGFICGRRGTHYRQVAFSHPTVAKQFRQPGCRLGCASQNNDAGRQRIETMNDTHIDVPRFRVRLFDILLGPYDETRFARSQPHRRQRSRFVHGQQMVVLEEYLDGHIGSAH